MNPIFGYLILLPSPNIAEQCLPLLAAMRCKSSTRSLLILFLFFALFAHCLSAVPDHLAAVDQVPSLNDGKPGTDEETHDLPISAIEPKLTLDDKEDLQLLKDTKLAIQNAAGNNLRLDDPHADTNNPDAPSDADDADAVHGDAFPDLKEFRKLTKDLGLTEEDMKELSPQNEKKTPDSGDDLRPRDVQPPRGMVAVPKVKTRFKIDHDNNSLAPKEDTDGKSFKALNAGLAEENAGHVQRISHMEEVIKKLQLELRQAKSDAYRVQTTLERTTQELGRTKANFQRTLDSAQNEQKSETEELTTTILEQKRAFDELFEEKTLLSQMLGDEQKTLRELQKKIQHPDLALWMRQRAERVAVFVDTPETDAVKYYARKYMAPNVTKMKSKLQLLEKRVERTVDHLLPARYGGMVALLLCIGLIGFPVFVTMSSVVSVSKMVSLRQYVLLGNVFLTAFSGGLCIAGLLLRQDPLQTLYEASESMFILLQLMTAIAFPLFLGVIGCAVMKARDGLDMFVFGCEFVFYSLLAMNYRSRVWRPAMLGQNIETSGMMYIVYVMDFLSMTALTISSARTEKYGRGLERDAELGVVGKSVGLGTGLQLSRSAGALGSLGGGSGKEE